jgi:dihydrofolate reductase
MRKIIVSTYATLNGVIENPQDWSFPYFDEEAAEFAFEQLFAADALLIGRDTYHSFAEAWPARDGEFADGLMRCLNMLSQRHWKNPWNGTTRILSVRTWWRR